MNSLLAVDQLSAEWMSSNGQTSKAAAGETVSRRWRKRAGRATASDPIVVSTGCGLIGRDWQARSPLATTMRRSPPQVRGFRAKGVHRLAVERARPSVKAGLDHIAGGSNHAPPLRSYWWSGFP
jgi:hypothetical protein